MKLVFAKLAVAGALLPMPDRGGRLFPAEGISVDADDPFWLACLADGSIVEAAAPAPEPKQQPAPEPEATEKPAKR